MTTAPETQRIPAFIRSGGEYKEPDYNKVLVYLNQDRKVDFIKVQIKGLVRDLKANETPCYDEVSGFLFATEFIKCYILKGFQ